MSRLIADELLPAAHDQPTGTVVLAHAELTRLQAAAAASADKAAVLVDLNERALAMRTGEPGWGLGAALPGCAAACAFSWPRRPHARLPA